MGRIVGIDFGERWIGLALSDETQTLATPLFAVEGEKELRDELERLRTEESVDRVVIGLPLNMDGSRGVKVEEVLRLKERLEREFDLPVETFDERLTTVQAEDMLREAGRRQRRGRRERVDHIAAQIILQGYLDQGQARRHEAKADPSGDT